MNLIFLFTVMTATATFAQAASACDIQISKIETKLVQSQDERYAEVINNFGEVKLYGEVSGSAAKNLSMAYANSMVGESNVTVPISRAEYNAKEKAFTLNLSPDLVETFVAIGKSPTGALGQLSLLGIAAADSQTICRIHADALTSLPAQYEGRRTLFTPYSVRALRKIYPLEKAYNAATSIVAKTRIARAAYQILLADRTPKVAALINKFSLTESQAINAASASLFANQAPGFPAIWRIFGVDALASAIESGMAKSNQDGKINLSEVNQIVWAAEKPEEAKTQITVIQSNQEIVSFQEL
jgi:hypothetical protein